MTRKFKTVMINSSLNVTVFLYPAPYLGQAKTKYGKYYGQWDIGRWYTVVFSR